MSRTRRDHIGASCHGMYWLGLKGCLGRDKKIPTNPPGWFKRMRRRIERARAHIAVILGRDPERIRRGDRWDWN